MSETLRQHLLMPTPPPRVLVTSPKGRAKPRILVPNICAAGKKSVTPIFMDSDVDIRESFKREAVLKIQRRRAQQRLRSQRYREKKKKQSNDHRLQTKVSSGDEHGRHNKPLGIGRIITLKPHDTTEEVAQPRYFTKSGETLLGKKLEKTKAMMRNNGIVLGYQWATDEHGRKYLAGSKLVRVDPNKLHSKKRLQRSQDLDELDIKVEEIDIAYENFVAQRDSTDDWQCVPAVNDWTQHAENITMKLEDSDDALEESQNTVTRDASSDLNLRQMPPALTWCRYSLYRRSVLKTKSRHTLYLAASRKKSLQKKRSVQHRDSPQPLLNKQSNVTKKTIQINQACSIALFKVRNDLKKNVPKRKKTILNGKNNIAYNEPVPLVLNAQDHIKERTTRSKKRDRSDSSDNTQELKSLKRRIETSTSPGLNRKQFKEKSVRDKTRANQVASGYDVASNEEQLRRSRRVRNRRYNFLKSSKQSARLQQRQDISSGSAESQGSNSPRITHIESLSSNQTLSWEVVDYENFAIKEEPDEP